jgi:hypothetical protein
MKAAWGVLIFAIGFFLLMLLWVGSRPEPCQKDVFFAFKGTQLDCEAKYPKPAPDLLAQH